MENKPRRSSVSTASVALVAMLASGCALNPSQQISKEIEQFLGRQQPKSMAVAYYTDGRWVAGTAWGQPSLDTAKARAIQLCEERAEQRGAPIKCRTIYENNTYISQTASVQSSREPAKTITAAPSKSGTGSGAFISSDGLVLTAEHVIRNATHIEVITSDGSRVRASVQSASRSLDLAVLATNLAAPAYLPVRLFRPTSGAKVFTVGYPVPGVLGQTPKVSDGIVNATSGLRDDAGFMQISVPIQPGNSGGPVVTEDGQLVGVVSSSAAIAPFLDRTGTVPQNVNWAVHSSLAVTMLGKEGIKQQPKTREQSIADTLRASVLVIATTN